jgi:hypothetical protein
MNEIRSNNNNVLIHKYNAGAYTQGSWYRVLYHQSNGTAALAKEHSIPTWVKSVELLLTPANYTDELTWGKVKNVSIKVTSRDIYKDTEIVGTLPPEIFGMINNQIPEIIVFSLLHGNHLPYIDWDRCADDVTVPQMPFGVPFKSICKQPMTQRQYWAMQVAVGGGPGLLLDDVKKDWEHHVKWHNDAIKTLCGEFTF